MKDDIFLFFKSLAEDFYLPYVNKMFSRATGLPLLG